MNFLRNHWYHLTVPIFIASTLILWFLHSQMSAAQILLFAGFMALLVHQFEEYVLPGGAPLVLNYVLFDEKTDYDRYPGNKQSSLLVNLLAYPFYLSAVFFPELIWLGLAQVFFGFFQFFGHGIAMNVKGKTRYNPGLLSVILLHIPLGILYIVYIHQYQLASRQDYLIGSVVFVAAVVLITVLPVQLLKNRRSPYPFTPQNTKRFYIIETYKEKGV